MANMVEKTNFCRSLLRAISIDRVIFNSHRIDIGFYEKYKFNISMLLSMSTKFLLPYGGAIIEDDEFRGLSSCEKCRLPFPAIALEYREDRDIDLGAEKKHGERLDVVLLAAAAGQGTGK